MEPPNDSQLGVWFTIHETDILQALIEAHAGIQPATVLARLKYESRKDNDEKRGDRQRCLELELELGVTPTA